MQRRILRVIQILLIRISDSYRIASKNIIIINYITYENYEKILLGIRRRRETNYGKVRYCIIRIIILQV